MILVPITVCNSVALDEEIRLQTALFSSYNKALRPPAPVNISVNLRFLTLLFMEQQEENMMFSGDFEMVIFEGANTIVI